MTPTEKTEDGDAWDRQIEEDARNGKLHQLYARLVEEDGGEPKVELADVLRELESNDPPGNH